MTPPVQRKLSKGYATYKSVVLKAVPHVFAIIFLDRMMLIAVKIGMT